MPAEGARPMNKVSSADVQRVAIASIVVGVRRRSTLGRLQSLERSIQKYGLIHPIVLRNGNELVAGQRRLEACRRLGWTTIPARAVEHMSDDDLRAIEFDENREREALNTYDDSKQRLAEIRQAEAELKAEAELLTMSVNKSKPKRGRPRAGKSKRAITEETGIPDTTQRRIEQHVAIADRFPFMQRGSWKQHHVLEAGSLLDQIPPREQTTVGALLDQDGIPPKKAIEILQNVVRLPPADRQEIYRRARSSDEVERTSALTKAAALPDPVDPGLLLLGNAEEHLRKAARACRSSEFKPQVAELADDARQLLTAFQRANSDARRSVSESATAVRVEGRTP